MKDMPVVVFPLVYEIPLNLWRWCRLQDVADTAANIARMAGDAYAPSPADLVRWFAVLVRPNTGRLATGRHAQQGNMLFRYTFPSGDKLCAKEVPCKGDMKTDPPYAEFAIDGITGDCFVPEGWAKDVLRAVRKGASSAALWGDHAVGFPRRERGEMIRL